MEYYNALNRADLRDYSLNFLLEIDETILVHYLFLKEKGIS